MGKATHLNNKNTNILKNKWGNICTYILVYWFKKVNETRCKCMNRKKDMWIIKFGIGLSLRLGNIKKKEKKKDEST